MSDRQVYKEIKKGRNMREQQQIVKDENFRTSAQRDEEHRRLVHKIYCTSNFILSFLISPILVTSSNHRWIIEATTFESLCWLVCYVQEYSAHHRTS